MASTPTGSEENHVKDLSEETNLAKSYPQRLAELVDLWEKMNSEMSEPLF